MDISKFIKTKRVVVVPGTEEDPEGFWVESSNARMNLHNRKRMDAAVEIMDWADLYEVFTLLDLKWNLTNGGVPVAITKELFVGEDSPIVEDVWYKINEALSADAAVSQGESTGASNSASMEAALSASPVALQTGTSSASPQESSESLPGT